MDVGITAIGTANPPYKRTQLDTAELICAGFDLTPAEKRLLKAIYKATGIHYRHSVLSDYCKLPGQFEFYPNDPKQAFPTTKARMQVYKEHALLLVLKAIENCFANLENFNQASITHLIIVSCTGMYAPGLDIEIVQTLNLNSATKRTSIVFMGCYGAFNAIKVADAICKAESQAKVLIVSVEICTIHFQRSMSLDNVFSNAIFADGAAAALVESVTNQPHYFSLQGFFCDLVPQTSQEMTWHVADFGFDIALSTYVPDIIQSGIGQLINKLLTLHHFSETSIDLYAIHPGGIKILEACEKALNITPEQNKYAYEVLRNYGNMSSATILFVLKGILDDIKEHQNKTIFSCAFGPGLTMESMLLRAHSV